MKKKMLSFPNPKNNLLGFSVTLGQNLLMDTQNISRQSTDAYKHSSKLWQFDAEMLSVFPGKELDGAAFAAWITAYGKRNAIFTFPLIFLFFFLFIKVKMLFEFLLVGENGYYCRSFVKAKWCNSNF